MLKQLVSTAEQLGTGPRWDVIASHFPDRSDVQCQQRWAKVVNPELVKGPWTKEVGVKHRARSFKKFLSSTFVNLPPIILYLTHVQRYVYIFYSFMHFTIACNFKSYSEKKEIKRVLKILYFEVQNLSLS